MAKDLLDPTAQDNTSENTTPERNVSQQDYEDKFNAITGSPEDTATQNEFKYSPDSDRQNLAASEGSGGTADTPKEELDKLNEASGGDFFNPHASGDKKQSKLKGLIAKRTPIGLVLGGGGGLVGLLVLLSGFGSSLALVHAKNNAEKRYDGISSYVLSGETDNITLRDRYIHRPLRNWFRTQNGLNRLDRALTNRGFEFDSSGNGGRGGYIMRDPSTGAARSVTPSELKRINFMANKGVFNRNRISKAFADATGMPRASFLGKATRRSGDVFKGWRQAGRADLFDQRGSTRQIEEARRVTGEVEGANRATNYADEMKDTGDSPRPRVEAAAANDVVTGTPITRVTQSLGSRVGGALRGSVNDVLVSSCRVGKAASAVYTAASVAKRYNLIKLSGVFFNNADAVVTGTVDSELLDDFMKFTQTDYETGESWLESGGMQYINGDPAVDSSKISGPHQQWFGTGKESVGGPVSALLAFASLNIGIGPFSGNLCNQIDSIGGTIVLTGGEYISMVFTGGTSRIATGGLRAAIRPAISGMVRRTVAVEAATGLAELWITAYVGNLMSSTMVTLSDGEGGPFMGDAFASSSGAMFESRNRGFGMRPLNRIAYLDLESKVREQRRTEFAQRSFFDRFLSLDVAKADSLAATVIARSPVLRHGDPLQTARSTIRSVASLSPVQSANTFTKTALLNPTVALAQSTETDRHGYVIDPFGNYIVGNDFSDLDGTDLASIDNQIDDSGDPIAGSDLENYIETCTDVSIHKMENNDNLEGDCVAGSSKIFQYYLAVRASIASLDANYDPESSSSSGSQPGSGQTPPPPDGEVTEADTVHVPSCGGTGWSVHRSIEQNVDAMCRQAASDGTPLTIGNSWRSSTRQVELRRQNCGTSHYAIYEMPSSACRPPTAPPGRSMHQRGLAIDFANCSSRGTACFRWLQANAARYGLYNLPSEPWHWSTTGN